MQKLRKMSLPAAAVLSTLLAAVLTVLLCLPGAALIAKELLPMELMRIWAMVSAGAGSLAAAALTAGTRRRQTLPAAALTAAGMLLLAAVLCAAAGDACAFGPWFWRLAVFVFIGGFVGALLSVRQNPHRKRRRPGR